MQLFIELVMEVLFFLTEHSYNPKLFMIIFIFVSGGPFLVDHSLRNCTLIFIVLLLLDQSLEAGGHRTYNEISTVTFHY